MFFQHEVISNTVLNSKFNLIKFKSKSSGFNFKIGQFTTIKINDTVFRCYSFASTPEELPYWDIFVDITPGGPGTTYLKFLQPGRMIETLSVGGQFELNKRLRKNIFGATGCGIAPFLPMLKKLAGDKRNEVYVFWGLRTENDIALKDAVKLYSKLNKNIHFEIVLSKPSDKWNGKVGHVTERIVKLTKEISGKGTGIYLSGSEEFTTEAYKTLVKQGFSSSRIYHEACY